MLSNRPIIFLGRFFDGLCGGRVLILNLALALSATAPFHGKADSPDLFFKDGKAAATRDARDAEVAVLGASGISAGEGPPPPPARLLVTRRRWTPPPLLGEHPEDPPPPPRQGRGAPTKKQVPPRLLLVPPRRDR